jgi:Protein of unknown function (DUF2892)
MPVPILIVFCDAAPISATACHVALSLAVKDVKDRLLSRFQRKTSMTIDNAVLSLAGFFVLLSLALGFYVSEYWYLLTAFAGLNMLQAGFTGFCPAAMVFKRLGLKAGCAFK